MFKAQVLIVKTIENLANKCEVNGDYIEENSIVKYSKC